MALNQGQLPARRGSHGEQGVRLRRAEEIETLSHRTVVEVNAESRLAPAAGDHITRRPERAQRLASERTGRAARRHVERAARSDRSQRPSRQRSQDREMVADAR